MHGCPSVGVGGTAALAAGCPALERLSLGGNTTLGVDALAHIGQLSRLRSLSLGFCPAVDDAALRGLVGLTGLTQLDVDCSWRVSAEGLAAALARSHRATGRLPRVSANGCPRVVGAPSAHDYRLAAVEAEMDAIKVSFAALQAALL
jgi:hypothetical protein